ncbi:aminotransferase A [Ammoniphilus sp. 3BR4]|uniref:aminotransferase A n=1 Tax=Ammoniphilus sp. 3BR4 TaxID=3158265 RepID=UPI003466FF69
MEHLLNKRVQEIQISGIRKFSNKVAQYPDAISLTIGQPDFPTPEHIKEAGKQAIDDNKTTYTQNAGLIQLRKAACQFLEHQYGLSYDPETEVITTNGASEAIDIAFRTILEEGSEVILPGPIYPGYEPLIKLCGAVPVYVDTRKSDFKVSAEMIAKHLTEKTRCIILPYPSNPTGVVLDQESIQEIAALLQDKKIFVLSDEIYSELLYSGQHQSIAAIPGLREKTIVINGLSKSHSMTGWRIGFTFAPAYITQQMLKVHQYNVTCASTISQYAAVEALTNGIHDADAMKGDYKVRREYVYERLVAMKLDVVKPEGAFYIFPSIEKYGLDSFDFATQLLEKERLAVVPGSAFSEYGEGFVRLSYAYSMEVLKEGLDRFERFIRSIEG